MTINGLPGLVESLLIADALSGLCPLPCPCLAEFERLHQIIVKETEASAKIIFQAETEAKNANAKANTMTKLVFLLVALLGLALGALLGTG